MTTESKKKSLIAVIGHPQGCLEPLGEVFKALDNYKDDIKHIIICGDMFSETEPTACSLISVLKERRTYKYKQKHIFLRGAREYRLLKGRQTPLLHKFRQSHEKEKDKSKFITNLIWVEKNTVPFFETDKFFICPTGLNPKIEDIDSQVSNSLAFNTHLWKDSVKVYEKTVVSGGVKVSKVKKNKNKILLNTNPERAGILSTVILNDDTGGIVDIIQAHTHQKKPKEGDKKENDNNSNNNYRKRNKEKS